MIDSKPTEYLGEMIARWDAFYASNFDLIFRLSKSVTGTEKDANKLTERVFLHLLLAHTDLILQNNADSIADQIAIDFPQLVEIRNTPGKVSATSLLRTYYVAN